MKTHKQKILYSLLSITSIVIIIFVLVNSAYSQENMEKICLQAYQETEQCPIDNCMLICQEGEDSEEGCDLTCLPKNCRNISKENCPLEFCMMMINCSGEKMCHFKMTDPPPYCGDISYAGQDVGCCEGLIRRCGIEFLDGSCDMEGKNTADELPICIPCGDGLCGQFENTCNCPEDCK